ncbi:MAG TPA: DUF4383 domain-containing protein [Pseudonocardia sp.]|nr:DUF4383 domain-containing protein [Pseudonocardia sp.]
MGVLHPRPGPHPVHTVHRVGAAAIGLFLICFAVLGLARGLAFLATEGPPVLGLSSNGLLATISLVVGAVLLASAALGGPTASTTSIVLGGLFVLSGVANSLVMGTSWNLLAFRPANIVFSFGVGAALLIMGSYGRISGGLPLDNPYHREPPPDADPSADRDRDWVPDPTTAGELAEAERAYALHYATPEQLRRLASVHGYRSPRDRAQAWRETDSRG